MKKNIAFIIVMLISLPVIAQTDNKQDFKRPKTLGLQINPYAKSADDYGWAAALRYSVDFGKHFTLGFELVGNTYDNPSYNNKKTGFSLLMRYNIAKTGKLLWFAELDGSAWYAYWDFKEYIEEYSNNFPYYTQDATYTQFYLFVAPGVRIPFAKNKLSFDLMLKMSTEPMLFDSWRFTPTYRFNIHF